MAHPKVKFDWNKSIGVTSSTSLSLAGPSRSQEDKILLEPAGSTSKSTFGSGPGSAFTTATSSSSQQQYCCLSEDGTRCNRPVGNASYNKRIQKIVQQKRLRLSIDGNARHVYICDFHKNMIQSVRGPLGPLPTTSPGVSGKRKRKDDHDDFSEDLNDHSDMAFPSSYYDEYDGRKGDGGKMAIDMLQLQVNTLRRYKKHFHVNVKPGLNKQQLAEACYQHLKQIPINDKEAITYFIYMVKTNKNKLDRTDKDGGGPSNAS